MPGFDLHTHSTRSDGTLSPREVVELAAERGLDGVALTDHDTTDGLAEAARSAEESGIAFVPGIEFSSEYDGASLHVLAYWPDVSDAALREELRRLIDTRFRRGEMIVDKLRELGYAISFERVRQIAGEDLIARPHIAQAMVEAGIVADEKEAFDRFISDGGVAHVPKHALDPLVALDLIGSAGGVCVLAHPGMWRGNDAVPDDLIRQMASGGMAGLEVEHPDHDSEQRARYGALAEELGLIATGASDCHGERFGTRLGCETTSVEGVEALRSRARV